MKVYTDMDAVSLIQDKAGRVIGVVAKDNHTGKTTKFMADKGVILATGGFGANVALRQKVNTGVFKDYDLGRASAARTSTSLPRAPASSWVKSRCTRYRYVRHSGSSLRNSGYRFDGNGSYIRP